MNKQTKFKEPISAGELMDRLAKDPEYQRRIKAKKEIRSKQVAENFVAMEPVITDLRKAGFNITFISDLYNLKLDYRGAIPVLLHWLPLMKNINIKDELVSALGSKFARPVAAQALIDEFVNSPDDLHFKWNIGNSLISVVDDSFYNDIVALVRNKSHGKSREMLTLALGNMKNPEAVDVLIDLLSDEEVAGHAIMALGKLKAKKARPYIESFLRHEKAWVRTEAKRAFQKIDKAK